MQTIEVKIHILSYTDTRLQQVAALRSQGIWAVVRDAYVCYLKDELSSNHEAIRAIEPSHFLALRPSDLVLSDDSPVSFYCDVDPATLVVSMELYHYRQFQLLAMTRHSQCPVEWMISEAVDRHVDGKCGCCVVS